MSVSTSRTSSSGSVELVTDEVVEVELANGSRIRVRVVEMDRPSGMRRGELDGS